MLYNGYGEHNIQGIGDKHIPLIHNVMNTDVVVGVSDRSTDALDVLFNTDAGRGYLARRRRIDPALVAALDGLGLSGIANVLAAIKTAKHLELTPTDVIVTVATDSAPMYASERERCLATRFAEGFDEVAAGEVFAGHLLAATDGPSDRAHPRRSQAHLQSRLLHLGRAAGRRARGIRSPQGPGLLAGATGVRRRLGPADRGFQPRDRRQAGRREPSRAAAARTGERED